MVQCSGPVFANSTPLFNETLDAIDAKEVLNWDMERKVAQLQII
jgi:hypothetical protein